MAMPLQAEQQEQQPIQPQQQKQQPIQPQQQQQQQPRRQQQQHQPDFDVLHPVMAGAAGTAVRQGGIARSTGCTNIAVGCAPLCSHSGAGVQLN